MDLQTPKLRQGTYFPGLLEPRRRHERALLSVVQLDAQVHAFRTRRLDAEYPYLIRQTRLTVSRALSRSGWAKIVRDHLLGLPGNRAERIAHEVHPAALPGRA